jgi:DNA-binding NarL/FixJ family response regulator
MSDKTIRVLLVDDQELFVESLAYVIRQSASDMEVVGIAGTGFEAVTMTEKLKLDVILMDVRMPEMDGVDSTRLIHFRFPDIKIIMLTTFLDDEYVRGSLKYGAKGYILKNLRPEALLEAIRTVHRGGTLLSDAVASVLVDGDKADDRDSLLGLLGNREREVAMLMLQSFNNRQIAEKLSLSEQTVRNYISSIYFKLNVKDRFEFIQKTKRLNPPAGPAGASEPK